MTGRTDIRTDLIAEFRRRHATSAPFGSVLRDDFRPDSDVGVLVEFEPGAGGGLFALAAMQLELSGLLGRTVDLCTPEDLSRYFREAVVQGTEVVYAAQGRGPPPTHAG